MSKYKTLFLALAVLCLSACNGLTSTAHSNDPNAPAQTYYYAEFDDVPIPIEMKLQKKSNTLLTTTGIKVGSEQFKGSVEIGSLNKAMIGYLNRDGWTLVSALRGDTALLIFEKSDRMCLVYTEDGISTTMYVAVLPKVKDGVISSITLDNFKSQFNG